MKYWSLFRYPLYVLHALSFYFLETLPTLSQDNLQETAEPRVEEMFLQGEATSFPERVEAEANDVHSSVEHARCLSCTRETPLA